MNGPNTSESESAQTAARVRRQEQEAEHTRQVLKLTAAFNPDREAEAARADMMARLRAADALGDKDAVAALKAGLALLN